ncbi:SH3 domain-containing protein [Marinifilum sp.]|uniref:SH3 domain-containing protein n=1 Tax=Marinifilum sp. TaxID=2033137 RepID=UPI003BAB32FD
MKYLLLIGILLTPFIISAQIIGAVINDADGYTNIREKASIKSSIVGTLKESDIFDYNGDDWYNDSLWIAIHLNSSFTQSRNAKGKSGYIHRSRLKPIERITDEVQIDTLKKSSVTFKNDSIYIEIKTVGISYEEAVELSGGNILGVDQGVGDPRCRIYDIEVKINDQIVEVPKNSFKDLYNINLDKVSVKTWKSQLIIVMSNGSYSGFYEASWIFKENKFLNRFLCFGP